MTSIIYSQQPFYFLCRKIVDVMSYKVVINTTSVNSYGTRVLTSGIDLEQYRRNPVLLWMHNRSFRGTTDEVLPIGTVQELEVKDEVLTGQLKFDESDPFALRIKEKWDAGVLRMVSMGIDIKELSEDPQHLVQGQTRPTITRSKLREVSVVDIGSNDESLALYHDGKRLNLAAGEADNVLRPLKPYLNMNQIALKLGLAATANADELNQAIEALQQRAALADQLKAQLQQLQNAQLDQLVDQAIQNRKITADQREHFISLGKSAGYDSLAKTLALLKPAEKPIDVIKTPQKGISTPTKLSELRQNERIELRTTDPVAYKALFEAEYGFKPEL
jgi:HK97 family phage prohead protease